MKAALFCESISDRFGDRLVQYFWFEANSGPRKALLKAINYNLKGKSALKDFVKALQILILADQKGDRIASGE